MSTVRAFYRKKPVIIEAMQWDGSVEGATRIIVWSKTFADHGQWHVPGWSTLIDRIQFTETSFNGPKLEISTLEGTMVADPWDFIIRGVAGEWYPCKPDIFHASYEWYGNALGVVDEPEKG